MTGKKTERSGGKLCFIGDIGKEKLTLENYKKLVKEPKFICKGCGRAAANDSNLCAPEKM